MRKICIDDGNVFNDALHINCTLIKVSVFDSLTKDLNLQHVKSAQDSSRATWINLFWCSF
ncbi:MAG TPA: hypothetical protein VHB70_15120 [Parafilimonas sp.]|nr:hypothetical protein [Parafilimonas sp.]